MTRVKPQGAHVAHNPTFPIEGSSMAFMMVLLVALLGVTVWAYFHTNPPGVPARSLAIYNAIVFLVAVPAGIVVGMALYSDAVVVKGGHAGMPMYLSIMAGGTVFLVVMALGGMARNFFVFPHDKREASAQAPQHHTHYG